MYLFSKYDPLFQLSEVQLIAVSHWGIHLVKRETNQLQVIKSLALTDVGSCSAPRPTSVMFDGVQGRITLHTPRAQQLSEMVNKFCSENRKVSGEKISKLFIWVTTEFDLHEKIKSDD